MHWNGTVEGMHAAPNGTGSGRTATHWQTSACQHRPQHHWVHSEAPLTPIEIESFLVRHRSADSKHVRNKSVGQITLRHNCMNTIFASTLEPHPVCTKQSATGLSAFSVLVPTVCPQSDWLSLYCQWIRSMRHSWQGFKN